MCSPEGAFYSAEDADSEGVEGKFYIWNSDEINEVLDDDEAKFVSTVYNIKKDGNFNDPFQEKSNNNILFLKHDIKELKNILSLTESEIERNLKL